MRFHSLGLLLVFAATAGIPLAAERSLVVTRASLWTDSGTLPDYEILVRDGRVAAVGRTGSIARPTGSRVIDAAGDMLLPGLIDAHVHLSAPMRLPADYAANPRDFHRVAARQLLRSGVTSGRIHLWDLPSATAFKADAAAESFPAPRLAMAGPALFGGRPDWDSPAGNVWGVKSMDDAVAKVRRLAEAGMDWIALHEISKFRGGELAAIIAEARRHRLRIMAAGDQIQSLQHALTLDIDSIDYLDFSAIPRYPDEIVTMLTTLVRPVTLVPMPGNRQRFLVYRRDELRFDDPQLFEFLPASVAEFARDALREDRTKESDFTRQFDAATPSLAEKFRQLRASGASMAIGTDCGSPAHFQADAIWWEMETWRQLGASPDEIVRAATRQSAALLGQSDVGHLMPGARGDFVLYRGRLDDESLSVAKVRAVAKAGRLFVEDGEWIEPD